ncbi:hypothetical protein TWF281_010490 [Arthrobotrys megalospora]
METLLESGKYSDFKILCGPREWKVHRAIICPQSDYFTMLCDSQFKEAKIAEIDLVDENPSDVQKMLSFLYSGSYTMDDSQPSVAEPEDTATTSQDETTNQELPRTGPQTPISPEILRQRHHIIMYSLGDKYFIEKLKLQAAKMFIDGLPPKWTTDQWRLMDDVDEKTAPSDQTLRKPIMDIWLKQSMELLRAKEFLDNIARFPTMELELLRKHARRMDQYQQALCIEVDTLQNKVVKQVEKIDSLSLKLGTLESKREDFKTSVRTLILSVNDWDECRHCDKSFNNTLEEIAANDRNRVSYILRCTGCQTKHGLTGFEI